MIQGSFRNFSKFAGSGEHGGSCRDAAAVSELAGIPTADTQWRGSPLENLKLQLPPPLCTSCTQVDKHRRAATLNAHTHRWYAICNLIPPYNRSAQFLNNRQEPNIKMHVLYSINVFDEYCVPKFVLICKSAGLHIEASADGLLTHPWLTTRLGGIHGNAPIRLSSNTNGLHINFISARLRVHRRPEICQ